MSESATDKQIAYIKRLGGTVISGLSKESASELIDKLLNATPPSDRQIKRLERFGVKNTKGLSKAQADKLVEKLQSELPPDKAQVEFIKELGGAVPKTKSEAMSLIIELRDKAPATEQQKIRIQELGGTLPEGCVYSKASEIIDGLEMDADDEEGKPASKQQIAKIVKLGGDPARAINMWRADEHIDELQEQKEQEEQDIEDRIEAAYSLGDGCSGRWDMDVRKPSKTVMKKVIIFGDAQGWGKNWEDAGEDKLYNPCALVEFAVYSVAPELLKPGKKTPTMPLPYEEEKKRIQKMRTVVLKNSGGHTKRKAKNSGCSTVLLALLCLAIWCFLG